MMGCKSREELSKLQAQIIYITYNTVPLLQMNKFIRRLLSSNGELDYRLGRDKVQLQWY